MSISSINYCETFYTELDLTRIIVIPTYYYFHRMQLELKTNALSVHSNLVGATHRYLILLMMDYKYSTLYNVPYVRPVQPGILLIPQNFTLIVSYELKRVYDENLQFFTKFSELNRP